MKREQVIGKALCNLWIAAGILGDPKFKNQIMDCLQTFDFFSKEKAVPDVVELIVGKTDSKSKLSVWLAHHLFGMSTYHFDRIKKELDNDMLKLILAQYVEATSRASPLKEYYMEKMSKRCEYHEHAVEEPEYPPLDN